LEDLRVRQKDNFKAYLKEMGYGCLSWIQLAQDRKEGWAVVNRVINTVVP
jgi:hypothetical protein